MSAHVAAFLGPAVGAGWPRLSASLVLIGLTGSAVAQEGGGGFDAGVVLAAPQALEATAATERLLACDMICSPFELRQSIAQISWPEEAATPAPTDQPVDLGTLRLEIVGAAGSFESGDFGAVRLSAVPVVDAQPGVGIDMQDTRLAVEPAAFQIVRDNRVLERVPDLPAPAELLAERVPGAVEELSARQRAAMERDAQTGGIGRIQAVAQAVEERQSGPLRIVVVEGMMPGQTYEIRLVQELQGTSRAVAQNICRVPVCPADFVPQ